MDDLLNDPRFPDRPDHPDFWKLASVVLGLDAEVSEEDASPRGYGRIVSTACDERSAAYIATERAKRSVAQLERLPRKVLERISETGMLAETVAGASWIEGFLVGYRFARAKEQE